MLLLPEKDDVVRLSGVAVHDEVVSSATAANGHNHRLLNLTRPLWQSALEQHLHLEMHRRSAKPLK